MSEPIDEDFVGFCRQATDSQLEAILIDEWKRFEHGDYASARLAAAERGWTVRNGERIS
jgi:hypothetical protein